jgi:CheY-like chemotaxis protein
VLNGEGYTVTALQSPAEALAVFTAELFDLVITDYRMPGMNGSELIPKLREVRPSTPIVLVSGMVDVLGLNEQNTGADAVVAKSAFEVSHMLRAVSRLLGRQAPLRKPASPQTARSSTRRKSS